MVDISIVDDTLGMVTAGISNQSLTRGFRGQDSGSNPTGSWVNSLWWENSVVVASPNGGNARAWFNDNVLASTVHNVTLDAAADVTLSSLLFNGSYAIAKNTPTPVAIKLQSSIALDTQIQAVSGNSAVAPSIKMAAGDPIITVAGGASLTLSGVLSDLDSNHPANLTINGPGTLTLSGANLYAGPTVLNSGTLRIGNASALGAASGVFTLAGGTLSDAGADVALNKGFTFTGNATIAPENNLTITGAVTRISGNLLKLGTGTATFNTPTATTNAWGDLSAQAGTLTIAGVAGSTYNIGRFNVGGLGGLGNETSDPYDGAVATVTVTNVGVTASGTAVVGGYWSDTPGGAQPQGTLTMNGSATLTDSGALTLGYWGGHGAVNVGGSSTLTVQSTLSVGYNWGSNSATEVGYGEMNVNDSGHVVQNTTGSILIGRTGGVGVWNQNGGLTETTATVTLGQSDSSQGANATGAGTLNLNGGTFQAPGIATGNTTSGYAASTLATVNFNGGTLKATADNIDFIANTTGATLALKVLKNTTSNLGAVIDTNGHAVKVTNPLATGVTGDTDGGLTKQGAGTLTLSVANTYTGPTVIKDGTLKIDVHYQANPPQIYQEMYTDTPNLGGNRGPIGPYSLGQKFTVNSPIQISQLGMFDSNGDGLGESHTVHLAQTSNGTQLASITFAAGSESSSGTYQNGYRFLPLSSPLTLQPGTYTIWFTPSGSLDNFGENQTSFNGGSGAVTRVEADYGGDTVMPTNNWNTASASESAASFIYGVPGFESAVNYLPATPVLLGGAAGSTPTLDLQGAHQQIASLADLPDAVVKGVVTNSDPSLRAVLTLGATEGTTTYSGSIDGNISLVKSGESTQNLTGSLTYTGNTTVNAGTLNVSSIDTPSATVYVATGALTATSIVADTLTIGGDPIPGAVATVPEPGTLVLLTLGFLGLAGTARHKRRP